MGNRDKEIAMTDESRHNAQAVVAAAQPATRGADSFDDMHDPQEEIDRYPSLAIPLGMCGKIAEWFDDADTRAVKYRGIHRWMTGFAASFATVAVAAAIIGLSFYPNGFTLPPAAKLPPWKSVLDHAELFCAGITVLAVLIGRIGRFKDKWLLHRHHAESYRLLRYRFLIHPAVWRGNEESARLWIESRLKEVGSTTLKGAVAESSPHGPFEGTQSRLPRATLRALTEYYLSRRLNPQKEYLANRIQRNEFSDWIRALLPWFFFLSIVAVICKALVQSVSLRWEGYFALTAALLPAAAAGVRTWRGAFEFSRNKGRFEAAHHALRELERRLVNEGFSAVEGQGAAERSPAGRRITLREEQVLTATQFRQMSVRTEEPTADGTAPEPDDEDTDAYAILRDLSWCEHILETEHREWLRLMYETEWFG